MKELKPLLELFDEDGPSAPRYDPAHLATTVVSCLAVVGALFWLLWTLLVYEGGLPSKVSALAAGTKDPAAYEGWMANLGALLICGLVVALLDRALRRGPAK